MSSRITRSASRRASAVLQPSPATKSSTGPSITVESSTDLPLPISRKRKITATTEVVDEALVDAAKTIPTRQSKRQKIAALPSGKPESSSRSLAPTPLPKSSGRARVKPANIMSHAAGAADMPGERSSNTTSGSGGASKRKSGRNKKITSDLHPCTDPPVSTRHTKHAIAHKVSDLTMTDVSGKSAQPGDDAKTHRPQPPDSDEDREELEEEADEGRADDDDLDDDLDEDLDEDPFTTAYFGGSAGSSAGISNTLRALSGMMSGSSTRLRDILAKLKQSDDPSLQLIALQELSELLLVSTEDNLAGHFSPDQFVKELVVLMQPSELGEENPEMMLLACRCIANLMEALPAATANVVYGGAVPILCQKLLEIHYIDLAEQALSTLEKISVDFPASIVREGGLTACLTYLDFFATSTQRTAVTTAANCCRNIPEASFPVIRDVMPILLNVLSSNDPKVVEQACLCVSRIVESFRYRQDQLEQLVGTDLLRTITRLLLPGTTNLIGPHIHTQFLRVLAYTAHASPKLSVEMLRLHIVDTLYQILTGVSPPSGTSDVADRIDSVVVMQALIHRPRDQVFETLNVICELLPTLPADVDAAIMDAIDLPDVDALRTAHRASEPQPQPQPRRKDRTSPNEMRIALLAECPAELQRFAIILMPTLTDAYSSTVNLGVRRKVLNAQLRLLSHLDVAILAEALRTVPYASYLASILSQRDHPTLVLAALHAAELLLTRLEAIYRYQFHREGVIAEIAKLANAPLRSARQAESAPATSAARPIPASPPPTRRSDALEEPDEDHREERGEEGGDDMHDDATVSPASSGESSSSGHDRERARTPILDQIQDLVTVRAQTFMTSHETERRGKAMRDKAARILQDLSNLASSLEECYRSGQGHLAVALYRQLATHFDGDALESITSAELLHSGIVRALLEVFTQTDENLRTETRAQFLETFMGKTIQSTPGSAPGKSPSTSFGALVYKLQDLLSRSEHFEVLTVHHHSLEATRGDAASMLAKQIRLRLVADEESDIPRPYRNIMVSIHAIATFKALDDYLRPRISLAERPRNTRPREGMSSALAAFAAAAGLPHPRPKLPPASTAGEAAITTSPAAPEATPRTPSTQAGVRPQGKVDSAPSSRTPSEKPERRSSRRHHHSEPAAVPPPPPPPVKLAAAVETRAQEPLECADEKPMSDDDDEVDEDEDGEDDLDEASALDAIVDDLDEAMADETPADPTAVTLEVASTGKITARKEDGTRVATPSQGPPTASVSSTPPTRSTPAPSATPTAGAPRHMSYAAAIQSIPQDWHLEFSVDGRPIAEGTTIYRAVHYHPSHSSSTSQPEVPRHAANGDGGSALRNVWSGIHAIRYKRVPGPPPIPSSLVPAPTEPISAQSGSGSGSGLPDSLDTNPITSIILRLLHILHALNSNRDDVFDEGQSSLRLPAEPLTQFVNTKLTAKLNRQLEEPLIVASRCLPQWSEDLTRLYPFLFPFETRHLFLQSTAFGYARSMTRWQNASPASDTRRGSARDERPFLGRLQRQKVRISRTRILESAVKVMELYGASASVLEVEYFEEVGTGLGPTLEFYSSVSKEFAKRRLKLWREHEAATVTEEYAFGTSGLFPAPMSDSQAGTEAGKRILHLFRMLGKFVARSMLDSRIIDVSFHPAFFRIGDGPSTVAPSLATVRTVDAGLARSLKLVKQFAIAKRAVDEDGHRSTSAKADLQRRIRVQGVRIEDLGLDFTLPGYPTIDLVPDGAEVAVDLDNVETYVELVIDQTLGRGVQRQVDAFRAGFSSVFPYSALQAFTPDELVMLFGRVEEDWSLETLMDSIKADHGFNMDSKSVRNLLQVMSEFSPTLRRDFLQFVTGSPKLPIGGFRRLTPMFTVVCKPSEPPYTSDDYLPSVMTCVNYLKLPDYSDLEMMRNRLRVAISEGQGAFHLS